MQPLNLPLFDYKVKSTKGGTQIFDPVRLKYVALTPEEWVRQHVINLMTSTLNYPKSLLAIEKTIKLNTLSKRYDIVAHNNLAQPIVLVECKAPSVVISQKAFDQIFRYNIKLKVEYLVVTNGLQHFCGKMCFKTNTLQFLKEIPKFDQIN